MAWNIPGSGGSGKGGRGGTGRGGGNNPFDGILDSLRSLFGGNGGGGGVLRWVGILVALWLAFSSFVLIAEQQRGVVLRFGLFSRVLQPGPHFKLPWPIERVVKVAATQIKTFDSTVPVLTRDENIVQVQINVQYRVADPQLYLFGTRDADRMLEQAALSTVREQVGRSDLDTVLGARSALAVSSRQQLQQSLDAYRTGLVVTELNLPNARPPEEVKPAFDDVNSAQQDRDRLTSEARAYAARVVPEARGEASRVRTAAEGYKTASVARATGDAARFSLLLDQYRGAEEVTRKRLWLETVQDVLADNRKVIGGDGRQLIYVPMTGQGNSNPVSPPLLPPETIAPTINATDGGNARPERSPRPGREEATR
ncbi:membrane protease subunit HflK [Luteimonas cucumeris]|uniref:Protein HflK n=1 Tax=Luteimonas cucumeris TaxID=985012 RepID=A0A562L074_9GAMM|nr:FtsH protease activity modulator HflK [Luteimonas cucumeris]TWI01080.1 membrane protease subunit HflK [Luteimonas cucumeris]